MSGVFSPLFWRDAVERAIATAAQAGLAVWGADGVDVIPDVGLAGVLTSASFGAILSLVKSVAASRLVGDRNSASLDPHVGAHRAP